jgi:hypothetical protein
MLGNMLVVYYRLTGRYIIRDNIYVQYIIYCTVCVMTVVRDYTVRW